MEVQEIEYGKPYKYAEMIKLMNDKVMQGSGKTTQLRKWRKNYQIEKDGRYYRIIKKLSDDEKALLNNDGKFRNYVESLIIELLERNKNNKEELHIGIEDLLYHLCLINSDFKKYSHNEDKKMQYCDQLSFETKCDIIQLTRNLDNFFDISLSLLKRLLKDSLNSMQEEFKIIYSKSFRFYRTKKNKKGETIYFAEHNATQEEVSIVLDIYEQVMNEYGLKKEYQLYCRSSYEIYLFYNAINKQVKEQLGYDVCFQIYKLILGKNAFKVRHNKYASLKLNENVKNKLLKAKKLNDHVPANILKQMVDDFIDI